MCAAFYFDGNSRVSGVSKKAVVGYRLSVADSMLPASSYQKKDLKEAWLSQGGLLGIIKLEDLIEAGDLEGLAHGG